MRSLSLFCLLAFVAACAPDQRERANATRTAAAASLPASGAARATATVDAEDGQWTMPAKSYAALRYSGLTDLVGPRRRGPTRPACCAATRSRHSS
jgi:hypothetical protein